MIRDRKLKLILAAIIISSILLLLPGISFSSLSQKEDVLDNKVEFIFSLISTPTPYPLPKQTYGQASMVTTLWRQLFGRKNPVINPSLISQKQFENEFMVFHVEDSQFVMDEQWWQSESEKVYSYVSQKIDARIDKKVHVVIMKPSNESCGPRGKSLNEDEPFIMIYADNQTSKEQLLGTLAHELGHVFIYKKYENLTDVALSEGMATWAAGDYWKAWKGSDFDSRVKELVSDYEYLPLFQNYDLTKAYDAKNPDCISNRDDLLIELASFVDYLKSEYGVDKLAALFNMRQPETINHQRIVYPPDYKAVYGLELNQLEYMWLNHIHEANH